MGAEHSLPLLGGVTEPSQLSTVHHLRPRSTSACLHATRAGRWEVRIGLRGSKHVYLGLHGAELEAARVYDRALVLLTGPGAATNFPVAAYASEVAAYEQCAPRHPLHAAVFAACLHLVNPSSRASRAGLVCW